MTSVILFRSDMAIYWAVLYRLDTILGKIHSVASKNGLFRFSLASPFLGSRGSTSKREGQESRVREHTDLWHCVVILCTQNSEGTHTSHAEARVLHFLWDFQREARHTGQSGQCGVGALVSCNASQQPEKILGGAPSQGVFKNNTQQKTNTNISICTYTHTKSHLIHK